MKRPVRGDNEVSTPSQNSQEIQGLAISCPDDQGSKSTNETRTVSQIGTRLTQPSSAPVHPFSSDITALDSQSRKEPDPRKKLMLLAHMQHLKNGTDRPNGKRYIGRQIAVSSGTYKPPKPEWLNRRLHLDAQREPAGNDKE